VRIRALEPHEAALHREVRLRALRDAPDAFGESVADAEARPHAYWEELTRSVTRPARQLMFLACEGDAVHGSTYGLRDAERDDAGRVGGTWVASSHRRRGIGTALLQAVKTWAGEQGFSRMRLWAPAESTAALSLYRGAGFRETGRRRPLPANAALQIVEMECRLP
jgi:ribosomal protein S18 acetylase RimI-like enzyme